MSGILSPPTIMTRSGDFIYHIAMSKGRMTYLEILGDFADETLERELANKEFGRPLVTSYFAKCDSSRAESVGTFEDGFF